MGRFNSQFFSPQGGIDFTRPMSTAFPEYWADLLNWHPTPYGLASGVGWAIMGAEISSATNGVITHLSSMCQNDETLERYACGAKRLMRWDGSAWTSIHDGTDFASLSSTTPIDSAFWNNITYFFAPKDAAANNIRQHTGGAGAVTVVAGSPRNARFGRQFANRLCTAATFNGSTYVGTEFQFSDLDTATTWSAINRVALDETGDSFGGMEVLDKTLILFKNRASPYLVEITGNPDDPFFYIMLPASLGLANPKAHVKAGHRGVVWAGTRSIHFFNDSGFPADIGVPVRPCIYPKLAAASYLLAGYDSRRAEREAVYFVTNIATSAHDFAPNTAAVSRMYLGFDFTTNSWFRGDLGTNAPRAFGNYFVQVGDRDTDSTAIIGSYMALDSSGGSKVFDLNHATTQREGADFTRRALTPVFDFGTMDKKQIRRVQPKFAYASSGTISVQLYSSMLQGARPTANGSAQSLNLDGTSDPPWADFTASGAERYFQLEFTTTSQVDFYGFTIEWEEVDEGGYS